MAQTSLIKCYWMPQNARVTAFTASESLRENQQGDVCIFNQRTLWVKVIIKKFSFFFSKSDISLPSKRTGGIIGIFLLFKNLFMIDQYVFGVVSGLSNFELNFARSLLLLQRLILCICLLDEVTSPYYNLFD